MSGVERDEELIPNTARNAPGGFGKVGVPSNYRQMRFAMDRIVQDFKAQGIVNPTNEMVLREYSRRMKAARNSSGG